VKIIGFGTYDRQKHPRIGIVLDGLAQLGEDVIELNAPLGFSTAERVAMLGTPLLTYRLIFRVWKRWLALAIRRSRLAGPPPDAVVIGYLGHFDVLLARLLFRRTLIILDLLIFAAETALDRGVSRGPKLHLLGALDRAAIGCASLVLVDTVEHSELLPTGTRDKCLVVPVGSPDEWFAKPPARRGDGPLRVVFFGLFTPLQGATVIADAIAGLPDDGSFEVTMIGSGQDLGEARRRIGNHGAVDWLDWVEPQELPSMVSGYDVCLGIFGVTPKALRVTPNKVFQGAAAGCAIVTSDTPPQRRSMNDSAMFVPAGDSSALGLALRFLAANPGEVFRLRSAAHQRAEESFRPPRVSERLREAIGAGDVREKLR
jgi:glycosyltransferase involved in cell wall biosynthesis